MPSGSERSISYDSVESGDEIEGSVEEWGFLKTQMSPYEDEPLADVGGDENSDSNDEDTDADGLTPAVLEGRFEGIVRVDSWLVSDTVIGLFVRKVSLYPFCYCYLFRSHSERCGDETLVGSVEFRCCREVVY